MSFKSSNSSTETTPETGHERGLIGSLVSNLGWQGLVTLLFGFYVFSIIQKSVGGGGKDASLVGLRSIFEPVFVARFRFLTSAKAIINDGYIKVCLEFPQLYDIDSRFSLV